MTLPLPFVLASGNPDKATEIVEVFVAVAGVPIAAAPVSVGDDIFGFVLDEPERIAETVLRTRTLDDAPDVEETGTTLEANARIKARALCNALGLLAIADDTGLEVDALDGRPGVRSARYAGEPSNADANVALLLEELTDIREPQRTARFATVALAVWPDGREVSARGEVEGVITNRRRGDGGFGYDPVFVPADGDGRTFAEMAASEKHAISHRGRAFRALAELLDRS